MLFHFISKFFHFSSSLFSSKQTYSLQTILKYEQRVSLWGFYLIDDHEHFIIELPGALQYLQENLLHR